MSVTGLCEICEAAPARHGCDRCGALVCVEHYDVGQGLCTVCARQARGDRPAGRT
ncbi:MAG: hypothetical protein ACOC0X_06290 [Halobacteriota archaeon]